MQFYVSQFTFLSAEGETPIAGIRYCFDKAKLPKLDWVPAMQRRRLSAFTKMALYCARTASQKEADLPVIFSSRHGDLDKTSTLLDSLAENDSLSPTAFSMSVHNASAGLFSIFTDRKAASNTVSAGKDSLMMAIVDAYARLGQQKHDKALVIHCDQALPESYLEYSDELQIDHCVAFVMSTTDSTGIPVSFQPDRQTGRLSDMPLPNALRFANWLQNPQGDIELNGRKNSWKGKVLS